MKEATKSKKNVVNGNSGEKQNQFFYGKCKRSSPNKNLNKVLRRIKNTD